MITIPEIIIYKGLDTLMQFYNDDYKNANQVYVFGYVNLSSGFDWAAKNQNCYINDKLVTITATTTNLLTTVIELNKSLVNAGLKTVEFFPIQDTYIGLRTISKSSSDQTLLLVEGNGLLETLCIEVGEYKGSKTKQDTYLFNLFSSLTFDRYNYLDEIAQLLDNTYNINKSSDLKKRIISIKTDFNPNPENRMPLIIISLTSEQQDDNLVTRGLKTTESSTVNLRQRKIEANYKLSIISDSKNETILLYNFIKSIIESNTAFFNYAGLLNISVKGGDVLSEIEMPNFFTQVISLSFSYLNEIPEFINKENILQNLYFKGYFYVSF